MTIVVSYGGGNNSAAMLVGLHEHGERPDHIVFADTGGEKPHTYGHMWQWMQPWLESVGFPSITIVRGSQPQQLKDGSLEAECLRLGTLPSKAYGFGSCSDKWKRDPFEKWARPYGGASAILRLMGFHAEECERAERADQYPEPKRYPLIEWGWGPDECLEALSRAGMPAPGKSACFFCPSSKLHELLDLRHRYPGLMSRALEMERRAMTGEGQAPASGIGLGRRFTWRQALDGHDEQLDLFLSPPEECSDVCFT